MLDTFQEIHATIRRNKLRTALTGFAVAWGIFMLIVLLGAGNGLINGMTNNMGDFLANSMVVFGGQTSKPHNGLKEGRNITLDDGDIRTTRQRFSTNVETVGAEMQQAGVNISLGENYVSSTLCGAYPNESTINKTHMLTGRFINDIDLAERRKVLVMGDDQARELVRGDGTSLVGQTVNVGDFAFRVVGVFKSDNSGMGTDAYTSFTTLRTMFGRGDKADRILFSFHGLNSEQANADFERQYKAAINRNHGAAPDDEDATWLWNRFTQNLQMNTGMSIIRLALWIVGLFTLLSGIVGVSNIMLISVKERTHEFGIRKAIGAKPTGLLRLIITESVVITTFFGYIGMLLGIAANQYMDATLGHQTTDLGFAQVTTFLNPTVGFDVCVEATLLMVVAGTLAGLLPAIKAARTRPIEALRAE